MNVVFGALVVVVYSTMLLVGRRAHPEGSYLGDGDRASGVFGLLASGFALLLRFMIDQTTQREPARVARLHGAQGIMPLPMWFALYSVAGVIFVFMLCFADPVRVRSLRAC
jgi:hypothetical protein